MGKLIGRNERLTPLKYDNVDGFDLEKAFDELRALCQKREELQRAVDMLTTDIENAWRRVPPSVTIRKFRRCQYKKRNGTNCDIPTQDRFGGKAMCASHVAHGDVKVAALLEDVFFGKD